MHHYPPIQHIEASRTTRKASREAPCGSRGRSMRNPASELLRIPLLRTPVNKGKGRAMATTPQPPYVCQPLLLLVHPFVMLTSPWCRTTCSTGRGGCPPCP